MDTMRNNAVITLCGAPGCIKAAKGKGRYCSDSCRAKASHARNYVRVKPKAQAPAWDGPACWCGKPARFVDGGRPKCGNHATQRRTENERWRKIFRQLRDGFTIEQVREMLNGKPQAAV